MSKKNDAVDVWAKVIPTEGCWVWTGSFSSDGYGLMNYGGRTALAHRLMYECERGPIPRGLQIDHLCRNRGCVNPWHMEAVTSRENTLRGVSVIARLAAATHCARGHEFNQSNTLVVMRDGNPTRVCWACRRASSRKSHVKLREFRNARRQERRRVARLLEPATLTPRVDAEMEGERNE